MTSVYMASTIQLCHSPHCFLLNSWLSTFNNGFSTSAKQCFICNTAPNLHKPIKAMVGTHVLGMSMNLTCSSQLCKPISTTIPVKYVNSSFVSFPHLATKFYDDGRCLSTRFNNFGPIFCQNVFLDPSKTIQYEFNDGPSDVEIKLLLGGTKAQTKEIHVDANESSLVVRMQQPGSVITLMETKQLYDKIKPGETIWYLDYDQVVINLRKHDRELKWPDIVESWESLSTGVFQLLKGTSIYLVGDSFEINQKVGEELAVGLGYTPLNTKGLLETFAKQNIESWVISEGSDTVAVAEEAVLESLSSHVRTVIATLDGKHGAARHADKWRHLYAGFTVWLSQSEAAVISIILYSLYKR